MYIKAIVFYSQYVISNMNLLDERCRLETFRNHQDEFDVPVELLAMCGYLRLRHKTVYCYFCHLATTVTIDFVSQHFIARPSCPFLCQVGIGALNIPIDAQLLSDYIPTISFKLYPCHFPNYASTQARTLSFEYWPTTKNVSQLVEAGFFYAGQNDTLISHCCNTEESSWTPEDNPIKRHLLATHGECPYLRYKFGDEYVKNFILHGRELYSPAETIQNVCASHNDTLHVLTPCGHIICTACNPNIEFCKICNQKITKTIKMFP